MGCLAPSSGCHSRRPPILLRHRTHGIRSNELADQHATFQSFRGAIAGSRRTATGGIRRRAKEGSCRAMERKAEKYGLGSRAQWGRRVSTYTWFRTGKGPQRQWLHRIGKAEDISCPCGAAVQSGDHIVWGCRLHLSERRRNRMGGLRRWEDIDHPIWVADE